MHPDREIATALGYPRYLHRQPKACAVRRDRQHRSVTPVGGQRTQKPDQCRDMEPQGCTVANLARQTALDGAQSRRAREYDNLVPHAYSRAIRRGGMPAK